MTDHPIPDDLVNKVGTVLAYELGHTMQNLMDSVPGPRTASIAREALAALSEWAGGALIDPDGWQRVRLTEVDGIELCTAHHEPHIEAHDTPAACIVGCVNCYGDGALETGDDAEPFVDCPICGGSGYDPCTLVPLYTLTKEGAMTAGSFADALRAAGSAYAAAIAMPYAIAAARSAQVEWETEIQRITHRAWTYGMPSYLTDLTISRARHRTLTTGTRPLNALLGEWRRTSSWWWAGWQAAELETRLTPMEES